ncbi:ion channel [Nocardioides caldifontis]|uniref:ion channel n=1 Tax=Nocardioides caldifontis TaxID=2588938 RepID=UPI001EEFBE56|nr:ion channel [Nocardioides caldifontis]
MRTTRFFRTTPCAILLVVQLLGVLAYPFMEDTVAGQSLLALFGLLVLGIALLAIRMTPLLWWVALGIAGPSVGLLLAQAVTNNGDLAPWSAGFEAALYFYAAAAMIVYMLEDDRVTTDELFAIGAVFTLLAWGFAYVYVVVQAVDPGSFIAALSPDESRSWTEMLYLSFSTLSGVGLSDVVPVKGHARSVVMIEQAAGLFYIAMVVTRLIGLQAARRASRH